MENRKFSISVRVLENNGYHVRFGMHSGMIPVEMDHKDTNRGLCGWNTMRNEEFIPFLRHLKPHLIYDVVATEDRPHTLEEYFEALGIQ